MRALIADEQQLFDCALAEFGKIKQQTSDTDVMQAVSLARQTRLEDAAEARSWTAEVSVAAVGRDQPANRTPVP